MTNYAAHNEKVFKTKLDKFISTLYVNLYSVTEDAAKDLLLHLDSIYDSNALPVHTGNLADGTGVGIYRDTVLTKFMPPKTAVRGQHIGGYSNSIWGSSMLSTALQTATVGKREGVWFVLISATPIASYIEASGSSIGRGKGFFSELTSLAQSNIRLQLKSQFPNAKIT